MDSRLATVLQGLLVEEAVHLRDLDYSLEQAVQAGYAQLEEAGAWLRQLSLSGAGGNVLAWALVLLVSCLPLLLLVLPRGRGRWHGEDLLLPGCALLFLVLAFCLVNPTWQPSPIFPEVWMLAAFGIWGMGLVSWLVLRLLRGLDSNKDQSYFLYTLSHEQIAQSLFPVGELEKPQVRKIAEDLGLVTAKKKDSTGICFIGERKFREFLGRYLPAQPGKIITVDGDEIGEHQGLMYHTLGQRKGLGIGGTKEGTEEPWYVVDKDVENNILVVAQGHEHPRLMSVGLIAQQLHWVDREPFTGTMRCTVKTRYRQTDIPCTVKALDDDRIEVIFDEPVAAVTPGQSAVFYNGEVCLGGGIIEQRLPLPV